MTPRPDREEELLFELLEGRAAASSRTEEDRATERSITDTLGWLAHGLEPVAPSQAAKRRLMVAVRAPGSRGVSSPSGSPVAASGSARQIWRLGLAAALAALVVGSSAFLYRELRGAREELTRKQSEILRLSESARSSQAEVARLTREMSELSERFNLVIQAGAIACPLLPQGKDNARLAAARGVLYIAGDGQHWFLKVSGLPELPAGRVYHFWFITQGGPVSAGTFRTASNADAELGSPTMPTDMLAVALTVEPEGAVTAPTGDRILFGHEKVKLL